MIPVRGYKGYRLGVLGLGRSGLSVAASLRAGGATAICWDDDEEKRDKAAELGFEIADLTREKPWRDMVTLIVSPGVPHLYPKPHPAVQLAWDKGVVVDNDIGLFFRSFASEIWETFERPPKVICITGSNGKSTTTALVHHILKEAGRRTQIGGNIGRGVLDLEPARDGEAIVLELSSYQIELARSLQPDVAVFLNLSPDHLDRHGGLGGYFAAKVRLFELGGPDRSIIGVDTAEGQYLANRMRENADDGEPVIRIANSRKLTGAGWQVYVRKGYLSEWRRSKQIASVDLRDIAGLPGAHNQQNACAAFAVCRTLGLAPRLVEAGLRSFAGLRHRAQTVAEIGGVRFVNDSKATNADAAEKSLQAFKNIRWIAGGRPKAGGIDALQPLFGRIEKAYLIGEAAEAFSQTLADVPHVISGTLEEAVAAAKAEAKPGDTVLLAPACASFDQFDSYERRGENFEALVAAPG